MEYVIMGYLKRSKNIYRNDEHHPQRKKTTVFEPVERPETYFCAINFNIRKFAMTKMIENKLGEEVE